MGHVLVIPAIDLVSGRCARCIEGVPGTESLYAELSDNPVELAQLWRRENAKCIHVTDVDSFKGYDDALTRATAVRMQQAVDVPIQFISSLPHIDLYRQLLEAGVYRVSINTLVWTDSDGVRELLEQYGTSRVIFGLRAHNGDVDPGDGCSMVSDEEYIRHVYDLGGRRLVYSETDWEGHLTGESMDTIRRIADVTPIRITTAGGIASPQHLWEIQAHAPKNVDSVVIGRALYENRFPCQAIWRIAEACLEPELHLQGYASGVQSSISCLNKAS